jgi:hypothetical protein
MLKGFKRAFLLASLTSVIVMALVFVVVKAGSLTPPATGTPGATMNTLEQIYDVLADNNTITATADVNGNVLEQLKYISDNIGTNTLQDVYDNSTVPVTIANSAVVTANTVLTIKKSDTGTGKIIELQDSNSAVVFSVDKTGQISSGSSSNLVLNAGSGQIKAAAGDAFYTEGGHPIMAKDEEIYRASMPIFGYDYPAQTAFASFSNISRSVILDANSFPAEMTGTTRIYKIGIRYATEDVTVESQWQVWNGAQVSIFNVPASTIEDLSEGTIYITPAAVTIPGSGAWYLRIRSLSGTGKAIRVYQVDLIAYDKVN